MRTVLAEGAQAETQPDAVEMPGPWETWKTKVRFPTFPPRRRRSPHQVNNPKSGSLKPPVAPEVADNERDERGKRVAGHSPCG